ncbi:MAG: alpha-amylase family glycosyl hydrolase, partial [Polyangiaceae bacterium]
IVKNVDTDAGVDSYHGYWQQDLYQLNPHFGDLPALRSMIAKLHDAGMKVVLDIVCNHMGQLFYYDINRNGEPDQYIAGSGPQTTPANNSPVTNINEYDPDFDPRGIQSYSSAGGSGRAPIIFIDDPAINRVAPAGIFGTAAAYHGMGRILDYNVPQQVLLGDFPGGLKDVATELPEVRSAMIDAFSRWVELADFDGFRIDTVKHVEHEFWQTFGPGVRQRLAAEGKKNFLMFGEAFDGNDQLLGSYTAPNEMDSVFYFSQHYNVFQRVFEFAHDPTQQQGTQQIADLWNQRMTNWSSVPQPGGIGLPPNTVPINFLDNHDVPRFLSDSNGDVAALRNAMTLQLTEEGIPCLYYGDEQDFSGGNDPANREVLWLTGFPTTGDTFTHFARLAALRKGYAALRRGDTHVVWSTNDIANEDDAGIFAFERAGGDAADQYALVVLNTNEKKSSVTANNGTTMILSQKNVTLVDVLDPARTTYSVPADGSLRITVQPMQASLLVPQDQLISGL